RIEETCRRPRRLVSGRRSSRDPTKGPWAKKIRRSQGSGTLPSGASTSLPTGWVSGASLSNRKTGRLELPCSRGGSGSASGAKWGVSRAEPACRKKGVIPILTLVCGFLWCYLPTGQLCDPSGDWTTMRLLTWILYPLRRNRIAVLGAQKRAKEILL